MISVQNVRKKCLLPIIGVLGCTLLLIMTHRQGRQPLFNQNINFLGSIKASVDFSDQHVENGKGASSKEDIPAIGNNIETTKSTKGKYTRGQNIIDEYSIKNYVSGT